jgi:hypothetical protein
VGWACAFPLPRFAIVTVAIIIVAMAVSVCRYFYDIIGCIDTAAAADVTTTMMTTTTTTSDVAGGTTIAILLDDVVAGAAEGRYV